MILNDSDRLPRQKEMWQDRCGRNLDLARNFWKEYLTENGTYFLEITFIYFHNYLISKYIYCCLDDDHLDIARGYEKHLGGIFLSKISFPSKDGKPFINPYYSRIKRVFDNVEFEKQVDSIVRAYTSPEESLNDRIYNKLQEFIAGRKDFELNWNNRDGDYRHFSWLHARCRNHLLHGMKQAEDNRNLEIVKSFCIVMDLYISEMEGEPPIYMNYMKTEKLIG